MEISRDCHSNPFYDLITLGTALSGLSPGVEKDGIWE
jgi:hypothetical protein